MANPRNTVRFDGLAQERQTYIADGVTIVYDKTKPGGSLACGLAAKMSGNGILALVEDGDRVRGRIELVEADGKVALTDEGFVELPAGDGATVTVGTMIVGALGAAAAKGFIRNAVAGDTFLKSGHEIIDVSVTTAVVVRLK